MATGIVIIGRNEGARLTRCLDSLRGRQADCVYVDSGSTDDSVAAARSRGVAVVELDMSVPFTAARARNAGATCLLRSSPGLSLLQFFDGDCEVHSGWMDSAERFLDERYDVGVVFGIQSERNPGQSIYNQLFDIEWDTPRGSVAASTGNCCVRRDIFERLGGFREDLIAGEDPEFCLRVRREGLLVWHLDVPMVLHDAEMTHFSQWWRRAKRAGYAFAEGALLHGQSPERHFVKERRSILAWGLALPAAILMAALLVSGWALLGLLVYPLQVWRIARRGGRGARLDRLYAFFVVLAKFPEALGLLRFQRDRLARAPRRLIEYK
jgi:GT2 family glycosyltransferase